MLKVILAEDDHNMRLVLNNVLSKFPEVEIIGEVDNGKQLIEMVEQIKPEIIFLDVDMPEMNGLDAAKEICEVNPQIFIVFATAYANYTHEAFGVYAFDYLVKPFKLDRIKQTMQKILKLKNNLKREGLKSVNVSNLIGNQGKLAVQSNDICNFVNISDIVFMTRAERKTVIHTLQDKFTTYESLQQLEERLKGRNFFRCHKGYIINSEMVLEISPWGNKTYLVKLANTKETALMTIEKAKEFRDKYCLH